MERDRGKAKIKDIDQIYYIFFSAGLLGIPHADFYPIVNLDKKGHNKGKYRHQRGIKNEVKP